MKDYAKMRTASYLLPDPSGEVVRELLDVIEHLTDTTPERRERVAAFAHEQWSGWMRYLFKQSKVNDDGSVLIPAWAVERWRRQAETPYVELSQTEQDSDRKEADGYFAALEEADHE